MSYKIQLKDHFTNRHFLRAIALAIPLFGLALVINYYASNYADDVASNSVTDIILSNIPVYDVDGIFTYGSFFLVAAILFIIFRYLQSMPFVIEAVSLFVVVRSMFITMTHIAPFPTKIVLESDIMARISYGSDLFFSGHTGLPFLIALIYWDKPAVRYLFLSLSVMFATVVLLGHMHYISIFNIMCQT